MALVAFLDRAEAASFQVEHWHSRRYHLTIWGEIHQGDDERFKAVVLEQLRAGNLISAVNTFSPGGEIDAAIGIGQQIRLLRAATTSPFLNDGSPTCYLGSLDDSKIHTGASCDCQSACFFVWSGGIGRSGTYVGVHRPYYKNRDFFKNLTPAQAEERYKQIVEKGSGYFKTMDVPDWATIKMFSVASVNMQFLSTEELRQFANEPPWTEELVLARCGKTPEGTIYTNPTRKKFFDCAGPIFDETALASAIRYMEVYGNSTPIPRPATPATLPPPSSPSPTPAPSPAPARPSPSVSAEFNVRDNRDPDGQDVRRINETTVEACALACIEEARCQAYSFDKWNRVCFLKTNVVALRLDPKSTTGVRQSLGKLPGIETPARMEPYPKRFFPGDGYRSFAASSVGVCKSTCFEDLNCVAYTLRKFEKICTLFKSTGEYFRNENADSGIKTQSK